MLPSSCLDGSVTPVGPGQNPQYTGAVNDGRLWVAHPDSKRAHNNNMVAEQGCSLQPVSSRSAAASSAQSVQTFLMWAKRSETMISPAERHQKHRSSACRSSARTRWSATTRSCQREQVEQNGLSSSRVSDQWWLRWEHAESFKVRDFLVMMKDRARSSCVIATGRVAAHRLMSIPLQSIIAVTLSVLPSKLAMWTTKTTFWCSWLVEAGVRWAALPRVLMLREACAQHVKTSRGVEVRPAAVRMAVVYLPRWRWRVEGSAGSQRVLLVRGTQLLSGSARGCSPRHQGRGRWKAAGSAGR